MDIQALVGSAPTLLLVVGSVLAILVFAFILFFLVPGGLHWFRLLRIQHRIAKFSSQNFTAEFKKVFAGDKRLSHLWKEYQDSLHFQHEDRDGQAVVSAVRATLPAELYFNSQYVVDSRLRSEFFKHLPGLFTGIGIIGTFSGLIEGLRQFQVSENAATVRSSLETLMHLVGEAFLISAAAITAAMLVTLLEKLLLASLYRRTEEIAHDIDARFDSGAGEEYLSRLVKASEDSASQSKILKDALVTELGELLRELTNAQIASSKEQQTLLVDRLTEASRRDNEALGATIVEGIQQSLRGPLQDIAETVKSASGDQSATAARMLQDVMTSFSQRLNDLFGGQISGLSDLNQQTARSIQDAVVTLKSLVENLEESSRRSTDSMADRMALAIEKMEVRQDAMNEQSAEFVEQIRQLVSTSQSETSQKLQTTLETIGTQVADMLATLSETQAQVFEGNRAREQSMSERAQSAVDGMSESVEIAIKAMSVASTHMAQNVAALTQVTSTSISKMETSAELLGAASKDFALAGDRVAGVMEHAADVSAKLSETSSSLNTGASTMQELLRDYRVQREAVVSMVTELRVTVEGARKEATLTADILNRIEGSANLLAIAHKQADEYLNGVSRVLGQAHASFAEEVKGTLDKANLEFHTKLTQAVGLLSSSLVELELTLASTGTLTSAKG
ncbi:hypothetical protein PS838_05196 [Pseudomonas fluorescens]|nr:hypothetical protein PS838_05196 [Pseudomonas fluorescens]